MDGILVVDKPQGITSRQVVTKVSRHIVAGKAGHTGTLDPLATGVLVVCIGRGTLLARYFSGQGKTYKVDALLGVSTDTYDIDGAISQRKSVNGLSLRLVEETLGRFKGRLLQKPPPYSAVKQNGKPLYYYAQRGLKVEPVPREVNVDRVEIKSFKKGPDGAHLELELSCGSGTYIRSLVHDLGLSLGCGACVFSLRRVRSGEFSEDSAIPLDRILSLDGQGISEILISLEEATRLMPGFSVSQEGARRVAFGEPLKREWVSISGADPDMKGTFRILDGEGKLIALYGPPKSEDRSEILGRAVRIIRPLSSVTGNNEAA